MKAIFDHVQPVSGDIHMFYFRPERRVRYIAGQFVEIELDQTATDERGRKRWFTLCSSPTEELLAIATRISSSSSKFKEQLNALSPGKSLSISEPLGDFVLPIDPSTPLVFVAAGIGITPYRSMVKWLTDTKQTRSIELIYSASNPQQLAFLDIFSAQGITPTLITSEDITCQTIVKAVTNLKDKHLYVSGPELMVEKLVKEITETKLEVGQLITDYFHGYSAL